MKKTFVLLAALSLFVVLFAFAIPVPETQSAVPCLPETETTDSGKTCLFCNGNGDIKGYCSPCGSYWCTW